MVKVATSVVIDAPIDRVWAFARDFNGHDRWHPVVAESRIEEGKTSDMVGCVRNFRLESGEELREQLLGLSDQATSFRYCLLDTPIPMFNYVAEFRLVPVTMDDRCFGHWTARFQTPAGREDELAEMVRAGIQVAGFAAIEEGVRDAG